MNPNNLTPDQLKERLEELIELSPAIESLSEEKRELQVKKIMESPPEKMQEIIKVLEDEQQFINDVEAEFEQHSDEIKAYMDDLKEFEIKKDKEKLKKAETKDLKESESKASELMKKLDQAAKDEKKPEDAAVKKKKFKFADLFKGKLTLMKFVRGLLAALIGTVLCGLAGILVVFGVVFAMGEYVRLDVVYNMDPLISFNAYWFALIYGALIGLVLIPVLRLTRRKSFLLSILCGGVIGALLLALSHMALGLDSDILLLHDSQPVHFRGYWIAIGFAAVVGFLGQIVHRLINLGEFFKLTSE